MPKPPAYEPRDPFLVRAPLLALQADLEPERLLADPAVRAALRIGSPSLFEALGSPDSRARRSLRRYLNRLSTRPTPYGLFAGVALGCWGPTSDLALAPGRRTRTRPDMGWLLERVLAWEQDRAIRPFLNLLANPSVVVRTGRAWLGERLRFQKEDPQPEVSVRATRLLREVLARARQPTPWEEVLRTLPGPTERGEDFLHQLLDQTLLLSDLRPPLTLADPAGWLVQRLKRIPPLAQEAAELEQLLQACRTWDDLPEPAREAAFAELPAPVQVDSALNLEGRTLSQEVGLEVARAAELLLRLSPFPQGLPDLREYRGRFVERYGLDREVPLLEMLDPVLGLGAPEGGSQKTPPERDRALLDLAWRAMRGGQAVVELEEEALTRLQAAPLDRSEIPVSLDLCALVAAADRQALDRGEFLVVVGPNLGSEEAGRNLGRFTGLLGAELDRTLERLARFREAQHPGALPLEISYLPRKLRSANVAVRRGQANLEVAVGVEPGGQRVPLDELTVAVVEGRFRVRWQGQEILPSSGHMLNNRHAPPALQFLLRHHRDPGPQLHPFDWGPAWNLPFLPRVGSGRVVLQPARWRLTREDLSSPDWRETWQVPRFVHLGPGDVRLLLDLDDPEQAGEVTENARRSGEAVFQEALPAPSQAWLPGPGGRYLCELAVPLRATTPPGPLPVERPSPAPCSQRLFPPGSEWNYLKLYAAPDAEDELLVRSLRPVLEEGAFFVRYSDPEPHLRVRLRGAEMLEPLAELGRQLLEEGMALRVCLDTYERETERYGGDAGIEPAEAFFAADSLLVADLLALRTPREDRTLLGALSVKRLLEALGQGQVVLDNWRAHRRDCREAARTVFRQRGRELLRWHGEAGPLQEIWRKHETLLQERARALFQAPLTRPAEALAEDLVHMHCNRLLGRDRAAEAQVLGLTIRLAEALRALRAKGAPAGG